MILNVFIVPKIDKYMLNIKRPKLSEMLLAGAYSYTDSNGTVVDDEGEKLLKHMKEVISRLQPVDRDGDDTHMLWIEVQNNRKRMSAANVLWWQVALCQYEGVIYLIISDTKRTILSLRTKGNETKDERVCYDSIVSGLTIIDNHLSALVDSIIRNPDRYNQYVENHLPYKQRYGLIQRSVLWELLPEYRMDIPDMVRILQLLDRPASECTYPTMNMSFYAHCWNIAYKANKTEDVDIELDDRTFFERYNCWQHKTEDWDSEEGYMKWQNSYSHNTNVIYARNHLCAYRKDGRCYKEELETAPDGSWLMTFYLSSIWHLDMHLQSIRALDSAGVRFYIPEHEALRRIITGEGFVQFCPNPYRNFSGGTTEASFPEDTEIDPEILGKLIKATKWEPQSKATPKDNQNSGD